MTTGIHSVNEFFVLPARIFLRTVVKRPRTGYPSIKDLCGKPQKSLIGGDFMKKTITIIALFVGIIGFITSGSPLGFILGIVAVVLAIIGLAKEQAHKRAIAALILGLLAIVIRFAVANRPEEPAVAKNETQETEIVEPVEEKHDYEYVFCAYILDNAEKYGNQYITTDVPIDYVSTDRLTTEVDGFEPNISAKGIDTEGLSNGDWIRISGKVDSTYLYDIQFEDAVIEKIDKPTSFDDDMNKFYEEKHLAAIEERQNFIDSAQEVSYEDLRRYPDTYDGKPLKLTITIKEAKPDGWIFQGDIFATYQGEEIGVYDARTVREPRFMAGDTITVYASGDGLGKIQEKDGSGIFAKVLNEYEIPTVRVLYTDSDNLDNIESIPSDGDMTSKGKEIGDNLAEDLAGH